MAVVIKFIACVEEKYLMIEECLIITDSNIVGTGIKKILLDG
jgi:hypothetical protein